MKYRNICNLTNNNITNNNLTFQTGGKKVKKEIKKDQQKVQKNMMKINYQNF